MHFDNVHPILMSHHPNFGIGFIKITKHYFFPMNYQHCSYHPNQPSHQSLTIVQIHLVQVWGDRKVIKIQKTLLLHCGNPKVLTLIVSTSTLQHIQTLRFVKKGVRCFWEGELTAISALLFSLLLLSLAQISFIINHPIFSTSNEKRDSCTINTCMQTKFYRK